MLLAAGCGGGKSDSPAPEPSNSSSVSEPPAVSAPDTTVAEVRELAGSTIFSQRCALCHGPTGHGDGIGAKSLNPKPRNFHDLAYMRSRTDEQLLGVIRAGKGAMPKWGTILTDAQIRAVLAHVRSLGAAP